MEIEKRISKLFAHLAKTNKLDQASGKRVGDLLRVGDTLHRIVFLSGSSRVDENSYFLVDFDWDELSEISVDLSRTNPEKVAPEDAKRYLEELIWQMKRNDWSKRGITSEIKRVIDFIGQYKGEHAIVTVPVWGLNLGDSSLIVGDVEFKPRPFPQDVEEEVERVDPKGIGIYAIAITSSSGDQATIFGNAKIKINRAINVIRAFSFPIAHNSVLQEICIEGDFRPLRSFGLLSYLGERKPGTYITSLYDVSTGGMMPLDIKRRLPIMNLMGFGEFLKIIGSPNKFQKRIVKAVDWLGEATKPDVLPAKFVKVAFSIDAMVGAAEKDIPDSGKKARIAERAAFLIGRSYRSRNMVWRAMNTIIGKRDEIAHGDSDVLITEVDVEEAGKYARGLLTTVLLRAPKFRDIPELAKWVRKQALLG